jgi:hypothetical protein
MTSSINYPKKNISQNTTMHPPCHPKTLKSKTQNKPKTAKKKKPKQKQKPI